MMKKLLSAGVVAAGIILSSQAHAAAAYLTQSSVNITTVNCKALDNNITVQLSKDVVGAFNCGASSFAAATCHKTGTNKPQTVQGQLDASGNLLPGYSNCDASNNCTFNGRVGFRGTSDGGRVSAAELGDKACNTTNIVGLVPNSLLTSDNGNSTSTQPAGQ